MGDLNMTQLTVQDVLKRRLFQEAEVIGSPASLHREVEWVHIMDITKVGQLLNGNELILSTGIGWKDNEEDCLSFLRQLIDNGCAGLCVELVEYTHTLPKSVIELAKAKSFPLILFHEEVRFIDITQDLHSIFLNRHHEMMTELETLSSLLNNVLLSGKGHASLLKAFHQFTGLSLRFQTQQGTELLFPHDHREDGNGNFLETRAIKIMNHVIAHLTVSSKNPLNKFQKLAADKAETALAQELMRSMYIEERKRHQEELWIQHWLMGNYTENEITAHLRTIHPNASFSRHVVCLGGLKPSHKEESASLISRSMIARSLFEERGFTLLMAFFQEEIVYILLFEKNIKNKECYKRLSEVFTILIENAIVKDFSIGQPQPALEKAAQSYQSAQTALSLKRRLGSNVSSIYEELHVYRIIADLEERDVLGVYIEDYLHALLQYDQKKNSQLLRTLKSYLNHHGNKQETAKDLFIVRQTLYHRLRKIEELAGSDFFDMPKRLAIEIALIGYEYIHGPIITADS
ncbi:PucR family transcriptional regulator [Alteribacillus sp. YIM 98480]|uniref:PucR family transcriptional regulator n=1 Tax=Alteribacillus sp. YIM 98480 TaxID=2606599 RepID=UPI00131CDF20|nr:PucR family transcriptional regulator [Alteribacillus sp. YIM 98480]